MSFIGGPREVFVSLLPCDVIAVFPGKRKIPNKGLFTLNFKAFDIGDKSR